MLQYELLLEASPPKFLWGPQTIAYFASPEGAPLTEVPDVVMTVSNSQRTVGVDFHIRDL